MWKKLATLCITAVLLAGCSKSDGTTTMTTTQPILSGWQLSGGNQYYYNQDGTKHIGWLDLAGVRYYFDANGIMQTGWLDYEGDRYFFRDDGRMGKGAVAVSDKETRYFTSTGKVLYLF